ncbi:hypothetical protein [Rugosimonospora africana]|uniref:Uncharacterized protein n=1 Tax=Rugosimonospora africana TaxID=556532 RepID=A0A8J3QYU5_9ACTN|nr:hypothetical protein [Rugosimonospora africana]GIH19905.1 hypothetical protein Raf01_80770 [Rugosimonospora africana]
MTAAIGIIGGFALGVGIAVMAVRWPFPRHWVWQVPTGLVVLAAMTIWAWNAGRNGFPATFGPFILASSALSAHARRHRNPPPA